MSTNMVKTLSLLLFCTLLAMPAFAQKDPNQKAQTNIVDPGSKNEGKRYTKDGKEIKKLTPEQMAKQPKDLFNRKAIDQREETEVKTEHKPTWSRPENQANISQAEKARVGQRLEKRTSTKRAVDTGNAELMAARKKILEAREKLAADIKANRLSKEAAAAQEAKIQRAEAAVSNLEQSIQKANLELRKGY
ncbi:MAG: hypothetical protein R2792_11615 [Saprospiraceae bacterium]